MTKELFVSSTPHETKVGLVEDDLLAEIYLERENEYTLAGSIYKGRVTRVLPGMQSAFVDIGLERDAFLYVSDFMELEDHDEDLTDVVPVSRNMQEIPPQAQAQAQAHEATGTEASSASGPSFVIESEPFDQAEESEAQSSEEAAGEPGNVAEGPPTEPRSWRGRRRRRGRRPDGRDRGMPESRYARPSEPTARPERPSERPQRSDFGPPPGYQPILLPGESISKYRDFQNQRPTSPRPAEPASAESATPLAEAFPADEPLFATSERVSEPPERRPAKSKEYSTDSPTRSSGAFRDRGQIRAISETAPLESEHTSSPDRETPLSSAFEESADQVAPVAEEHTQEFEEVEQEIIPAEAHEPAGNEPAYSAAAGTIEEEEIDEEEADISSYVEELDEDAHFEELEEEITEANGRSKLEETPSPAFAEEGAGERATEMLEAQPEESGEEETEEAELEEAQEEAEALLDAEAHGSGTIDARAEVRGPAATAAYQRPQRSFDRRRGGGGGRRPAQRRFRSRRDFQSRPMPLISDLLKEGQEILVQIAKEPIGKKGARITSHIALPGRFLVYMPTVNHTGVSRKIASEEERQRLKRIVLSERDNGHGGFIVRTAAQGAAEEELRADIRFLKGLWNEIKSRAEKDKAPAIIYHDLNVVERVLRDQVTSDFSQIWVDSEQEYERILRFANRFQPGLVKRVKLYTKEIPLFEQFGLTEEINKALKSKVWLKSGGYIVINQTEALVAIDINTGKYVGKTSRLEDTIVKTNVDAIKEIVRQIRLRDLGGIIVIDFIDMDERRNRQKVMQALEEALRSDRAPSKVLQFNDFGLVAITRKRVKQSLERTIGTPCPYCTATGYVKSVTTVCNEIYLEMRKIAKHLDHPDVMLRVNPEVAKTLKTNNGKWLSEMEELTGKTIIVKSDPSVHQEQFDIN
jgi:ribonuclease G